MQHGHLGGSLRNSNGTVLSARLRMYDSSLCTRRPTLLSYSCPPVWAVSPPVPGTDMIHDDPPYGRHCVRVCDSATVRLCETLDATCVRPSGFPCIQAEGSGSRNMLRFLQTVQRARRFSIPRH